jgi:hypothetical protein
MALAGRLLFLPVSVVVSELVVVVLAPPLLALLLALPPLLVLLVSPLLLMLLPDLSFFIASSAANAPTATDINPANRVIVSFVMSNLPYVIGIAPRARLPFGVMNRYTSCNPGLPSSLPDTCSLRRAP